MARGTNDFNPVKILTVVGARPQFIKAATVSRAILAEGAGIEEVIVHTGQHFDANMSDVFFDQLACPAPKHFLAVSGGSHGDMTGRMLRALEPVVVSEAPDCVLVYGDTNSTLAGALVAAKLNVLIAHVEAGLRSFNRRMPEEINRLLTDQVSSLLFCPTQAAVDNLHSEGIRSGIHLVGDVMYDAALHFKETGKERPVWCTKAGLHPRSYALVTCHRAENTDDPRRLREIFSAIKRIATRMEVAFPLHPRTRKAAASAGLLDELKDCVVVEPLSHFDMLSAECDAAVILTDSGGVQKEAFFFNVPCVTVRDETEWMETVELGWNCLVAADCDAICQAILNAAVPAASTAKPFGAGDSADRIVRVLAAMRDDGRPIAEPL